MVGLTGGSLIARLGRGATLRLSTGGMVVGGLLFALPGGIPTLLCALLLGLGAALLILHGLLDGLCDGRLEPRHGWAPAIASLFLVGMAAGRLLASPITRWLPGTRDLILTSLGFAAAGFGLFWSAPNLVLAAAGLALTGLGVALLYPTMVSLVVATWPHAPDQASARAALASGLAIGITPFLLGRLSDAVGLRAAYLIVPALLLVLAVRTVTARRAVPARA